jgi:hypothetical protein
MITLSGPLKSRRVAVFFSQNVLAVTAAFTVRAKKRSFSIRIPSRNYARKSTYCYTMMIIESAYERGEDLPY